MNIKFGSDKKNYAKLLSPTRIIAISFIFVIVMGTLLLSLPIASKQGRVPLLNACFQATSATCVTGLSLYDVYSQFTVFGQVIYLVLIQIGGLGLATLATGFTLLLRRKIAFRNMMLVGESSGLEGFNMKLLMKIIFGYTFFTELVGAMFLSLRFVPLYGLKGLWSSVFVSVSAFCNAGFDILGFVPGNGSITPFYDDFLVCLTLDALVFFGGIGFVVIHDIYENKIKMRFRQKKFVKLDFHSRVCITFSLFFMIAGALCFFIFEYDNTLDGMSLPVKLNVSLFQSVNMRTAGFASIVCGEEAEITKLLSCFFMLIGGCPGSTAGGIKVTTIIVLVATVVSAFKGREDTVFMEHRIGQKEVYKAMSILAVAFVVIILDVAVIFEVDKSGSLIDVIFETVSAFGTVGVSSGVTANLRTFGKVVVIITMFIGRVGPASLGIALMSSKKRKEPILPEGKLIIG
ncbi:MAG: potassium transporter TrkG [Clostridia bacterium]|nr:potassium transporter TrkG [Clostridia bacterium]